MSPISAAVALRESFGDRKLPEISRKITACVSCRKLKIKCHMTESKPPCHRCKARGLSCSINKSLQMLLENDASWKEALEQRIDKIEKALMQPSRTDFTFSPADASSASHHPEHFHNAVKLFGPEKTSGHQKTHDFSGVTLNLSCSLGAFPASSIIDLTLNSDSLDYVYSPDLISCGLVSLQDAESCFSFYRENLDPCIHHVLAGIDSLAAMRARSSLLTTAICTIAAFCTGSKDYKSYLNALRNGVSRKLFSDNYNFDDVRALCIGAFWLNDIASALNGLAVRTALELHLHRCITKMPHTKKECYERTRLYFLVYLCDHHCSLVYGKPPMTRELRSLKSPGAFLQSEYSSRADLDLISQVELWSINRRVFEQFGADVESSIVNERFAEMCRLSDELDRWYETWLEAFTLKVEPQGSSRLVFELSFHSAKLYLFSHVFRGHSIKDAELIPGSHDRNELARGAVESALAMVRCIVDGDETIPCLGYLPSYFATMVAFACVCLVKATRQGQFIGEVEASRIIDYLHRLVDVLRKAPVGNPKAHPLWNVAQGLETALSAWRLSIHEQSSGTNDSIMSKMYLNLDQFANDALDFDFAGSADWMSYNDDTSLDLPDDVHFC